MTTANAINASELGLVRYQGTGNFDAVTTTQYNTLTGAASNGINNVSPGTSGQVLTSQGASAYPVYADVSAVTVTQFDASGTWTKKANTKAVTLYIYGSGGGGGSGRQGASGAAGGGSGGGGGNGFIYELPASFLGATETVTIGAGGTGGAAVATNNTDGNDGSAGGNTIFGNIQTYDTFGIAAQGGFGGINGTSSSGGLGQPKINIYGSGGSGTDGGLGDLIDGWDGNSTVNNYFGGSTGGGGGAGADSVTEYAGGDGGTYLDTQDVATFIAGSPGGTESGTINGTVGTDQVTGSTAGGIIVGATGGGGGGGQHTGLAAGNGGAGGIPGGGGGGGGGSLNGTNSGAGGAGGHGRVIVVEYA